MKLIDEKGRFLSRINAVDFAVVLLIVAVLLGFYVKSMTAADSDADKKAKKAASTPVSITYLVKVRSVRTPTIDAIKAHEGKDLYADDVKTSIGVLENIEITGSTDFTVKEDGAYSLSTMPDKYDLYLTLSTDGKEKKDGIYTNGKQQLLVGDPLVICTEKLQTSGEILQITATEKEK